MRGVWGKDFYDEVPGVKRYIPRHGPLVNLQVPAEILAGKSLPID